ncbi:PilZ domain-containing protein [Paraurantiacibacter namhicola]|uniref:PilZ domain-containing protein n=1 Tax=Paraurantiacibacter namhicola TaxID=645517 RepID=A0A1C7D8J4_9SPHN|nr:PilZ domain-containing protein [Paraurantiacibacter namhicola]ANU07799.1 hypothetical protein A6F65_01496 [Paraurantiacibacter namhicola]
MSVLVIRSHKRYATRRVVTLVRKRRANVQALMIELSSQGCRLSGLGRAKLDEGDLVTLLVGEDTSWSARVRWAHDGVAGLRLERTLYKHELEAVLQQRGSMRSYGT